MKAANYHNIFKTRTRNLGVFLVLMFTSGLVYCQAEKENSIYPNTNVEDVRIEIGNTFIEYLSERKFEDLSQLFSENISFRALLPPALLTSDNPVESAQHFKKWFHLDEGDEYKVRKSNAEMMADCLHIYYVIDVTKAKQIYRVEQQIFCEVAVGKINKLSLLCSGPRKVNH